jgi:uncharacterized protein (TIGR03435 family)
MAIWFCGCTLILAAWWMRWRRVAAAVREASPVECGREVDTLRRLESTAGIRRPIAVVSSGISLEPGVFGIVKPVLLWPRRIAEYLSIEQVEAILAHELSHVHRRDNLAAAVHMVVEAVFWFHPLVWWIGTRLVDERERACDEDVIRLGSEPEVYAESILKTCAFCVESSVVCVAGVTGSDLRRRIERIMRHDIPGRLSAWRKLFLAATGVAVIVGPIVVGALNAPRLRAQSQAIDAKGPTFEVASVKPNRSGERGRLFRFPPGGQFTATNMQLRDLIRFAYGLQEFQISGGPNWVDSDHFDIVAKAEGNPAPEQVRLMMRALLAERFKLTVHNELKELPIYALVVANRDGKLGSQLQRSGADCVPMRPPPGGTLPPLPSAAAGPPRPPDPNGPPRCGAMFGPARITAREMTMTQLANGLTMLVRRVVIDRTGLSGGFDLDVDFTPDQMPPAGQAQVPPGAPPLPSIDPNGPSIFTALQEQLGLKLDPRRGPVDVLVIDRVEHPTED